MRDSDWRAALEWVTLMTIIALVWVLVPVAQ